MGKVIQKKIQGMSLWAKISLVTTLTLLVSVFMYQGLYKPRAAAASIAAVNQFTATPTIVADNANATVTGTYTVSAGSNRMMLVVVGTEYGAAPGTQNITVTYGTRSVTQIVSNATQRAGIWVGYLNEAGISAASNTTLSVTNSTTHTSMYVNAAVYSGVDQTAPLGNSAATGGATTLTVPSTAVQGTAGNTGLFVYATNWNGQTSSVAGYTERVDYAGANWNLAMGDKIISANGNEAPVSTAAASTRGSIAGVELNPFVAAATPTITTVSPNSLVQGATATSVTITGTNLTGGTVSFSNAGVTGGTPTVANATTITLPVTVTPGATTGAGTVTVTTGSGSANSAFTVTAAPAPTVTSTSPNAMTQGTGPTTVTINGTNFLTGATVTFSGTGVTAGASTFVSASQITVPVTVTAGATTGLRNVTVTLPGGQTGTGTNVFTVNVASTPPTITTVSPNSLAQGATAISVTITGTNLTGGSVSFSNAGVTGGTPTVANATTITLPVTVTPGATTGAGTVTVTTGSGSANSAFTVTAAPAPTVTSTSPNAMTQGTGPTTVTINGTNFLTGATVTFSGTGVTAGASTFVSASQITVPVTVTAGATTGLRNVTVTLPGGQTGTGTNVFTVNPSGGPGTIALSSATYSVGEAGGTVTITATRTGGSTGAVGISYATSNGTATAGSDYTAASGTLSWAAGDAANKTFTVSIINDLVAEADETFNVTLSTPTGGATLGSPASAVVTIVDNDGAVVSPLMHNSANLGTGKGTWGTTYNCETCHSRTTTNIKRIATQINTPKGLRNVVFTRITANRTNNAATGVFGNDLRTFMTNTSNLVCSACHHNTTHHQYSSSKSTSPNHYNNQDCASSCHLHASAFAKPAGASHSTPYPGATHMVGLTPGAYGTCTGCHATTAGGAYPATPLGDPPNCTGCHINAANFNSASAGCADCHGTNADGRPNGTTFPNNARSHSLAGHTVACSTCHNGGGTGTPAHGNSNRTAKTQADVLVSMASGTFNSGTLVCSATYCHGNGAPVWGGTLAGTGCDKCHTTTPGATFMLTDRTTGTNKSIIHVSHVNKTHGYTQNGIACSACHTVPAAASDPGHNDSALPANVLAGLGYTGTYPTATCATSYCHGNTLKGNLAPNTPDATVVMAPTFGTTLMTGAAATDCGRCHGYPPKASYHIKTAPSTYYAPTECKGCHDHVNAAGTGFDNIALHMNGIVEGGSCLGCHNSVKGGRAPVVAQMNSGNLAGGSHHVQIGGSGLTDAHCYQCHWEADASGKQTPQHGGTSTSAVNLVVYGNGVRPTTFTAGTTYISYTASLQTRASITKLNQHCLSCHNANSLNKTATGVAPTGTLNVTAGSFFNDGKAPNAFAWDSTRTSIDERYSQAATVAWSQYAGAAVFTSTNQTEVNMYGGNKKNTLTKALSAHGRADLNQRGFTHDKADVPTGAATTDEFWTNTSGTAIVGCYDCHNSHGSSVNGTKITSYTPSTTVGGIFKDISSSTGGYTVSYRPYSGGNAAAPNKNKHTAGAGLCFDCHNTATSGTIAKQVGTRTFKTPWGYSNTFGSGQAIRAYYETPDFGNFSTNSTTVKARNGAQRRYPVKNLGGSSLNKGGHFGASSALSTAATGTIDGVCTKCHDPHGVTSDTTKVTATKYGVPLLKGNWMTSPYREDAPPASTTKTRGGGDGVAVIATASIPRYRLDQNTFGATSSQFSGGGTLVGSGSGAGGPAIKWTFTMPTTITENATQFGGLCLSSASGAGATGCHVEANIKNTAAASSTNWRSMTRVHNTVKGWATTGGGNAGNAMHAFTCSKCHAPHNSNLPRLLVTNCLDWQHRSMAATGGSVSANTGAANTGNQNRGSTSSGMGAGRFPGGGSRYLAVATGNTRNSNSGPWFFGTRRTAVGGTATSGYTFATRVCHDSATAGGAWSSTTYPASQLWNTKSTW